MSVSARGELARARSRDYRRADRKTKSAMLDEFVSATGVTRKTAIELLRNPPSAKPKVRGKPKKRYGTDVGAALELLWPLTGFVCSKRLAPFLPGLVQLLEASGEWTFRDSVKEKLFRISAATCERLLRPHRISTRPRGRCMTKPGSMLRAQIPVRTWADWNEKEPGYCEMDLVHHCNDNTFGEYLHTLTFTDVATGWTEIAGLKNRSQQTVLAAVKSVQLRLPFPLKGVDSHSGSEFLNEIMFKYCKASGILFTRARPGKKNDQCRVEQKNGSIVRQNVGYDRFEGEDACKALNAFYRALRLQVNFLQPSVMLVSKQRIGARVRKQYDPAKTPCQRVLEHPCVSESHKRSLAEQLGAIKPMAIAKEILRLREDLRRHAR